MTTINCNNMNLEERRNLPDSAAGRYFSCEFVKKDKTVRKMVCKKWEKKFLRGEPGQNANPVANRPEY